MPKPLKEYVQQVLAEHGRAQKIRQALEHANKVVKKNPDSAKWRRKTTRRALFWEVAVDKLIELVADDPNKQIISHNDTVSFVFDGDVLVRLKKASMDLRTSNYPTPTAELFHDHHADLFGFKGVQRVEAVYIPNQFDTEIIWCGIVARENDADLWHFELAEPVVAPVAKLPTPIQPSAASMVTVKNQAKRANRKTGTGDDGK